MQGTIADPGNCGTTRLLQHSVVTKLQSCSCQPDLNPRCHQPGRSVLETGTNRLKPHCNDFKDSIAVIAPTASWPSTVRQQQIEGVRVDVAEKVAH